MAATTLPAPSSQDNWVLISSVTPTAAASTVTFTGISGYRRLVLKVLNPVLGTAGLLNVTINGDTGANYANTGFLYDSAGAVSSLTATQNASNIQFSTTNATDGSFTLSINDANTLSLKSFEAFGVASAGARKYPNFQGVYYGSAAITSVTLTTSTTFTAAGTVALYGAPA